MFETAARGPAPFPSHPLASSSHLHAEVGSELLPAGASGHHRHVDPS